MGSDQEQDDDGLREKDREQGKEAVLMNGETEEKRATQDSFESDDYARGKGKVKNTAARKESGGDKDGKTNAGNRKGGAKDQTKEDGKEKGKEKANEKDQNKVKRNGRDKDEIKLQENQPEATKVKEKRKANYD